MTNLLDSDTVVAQLEDAGMDAHVDNGGGMTTPYLHVEGATYTAEVTFATDVDDTLDLNYLESAYRWDPNHEPWNIYRLDFGGVTTLDGLIEALDAATR